MGKRLKSTVVTAPGELPVILSDFEAEINGKKVILEGMRDIEAMSATPEWQEFEREFALEMKRLQKAELGM